MTIETVQAGDPAAKDGDVVWVHYTGRLTDGTKFDSSFDHPHHAPYQFVLGEGGVIKGWEEGILGMKVGEKRKLTIPPELACGAKGSGQVPANATLVFDMELVGLARPGK
jgi:FKBP-type peptidyl-prolyl cis-trans isomerase